MIQEPVSTLAVKFIAVYLGILIILNNVPENCLAPLIVSRPFGNSEVAEKGREEDRK